ncbi:MAG: hypothetical protein JNM85_09825 [Chthonomonas sp.]|nr:hypothetical protein [Chthonomonas sp.]
MSVLSIQLQGLLVGAHQEGDAPAIVALGRQLFDLNLAAQKSGLRVGMSVREARSLAPGLCVHEYDLKLYEPHRRRWLEIARDYADMIESTSPQHAYLDLSGHPDSESIAHQCVDQIERKVGCEVTSGLSPTKWVAGALAATRLRVMHLPGLALVGEKVQVLAPVEPRSRELLEFLGYRRVGQVQQLSLATLRSQFGSEAMRIHLAANGALHEPIIPNYPFPSLASSRTLWGGCSDSEQLSARLIDLCKELVAQLSTQVMAAKSMSMRVSFEDRDIELQQTYSKPIRTANALRISVMRAIEELGPTEPIYKLTLILPDLVPAESRQKAIQGIAYSDKGCVEDVIEPLRNQFGVASIHLASEHRVPRRVEVLRLWSRVTGWK